MRTTSATAVARNPFSSIEAAIAASSRWRFASAGEAAAPEVAAPGVAAPGVAARGAG